MTDTNSSGKVSKRFSSVSQLSTFAGSKLSNFDQFEMAPVPLIHSMQFIYTRAVEITRMRVTALAL